MIDTITDCDAGETWPPLPPLPDTSHLPVLCVHLSDDGTLAYRLPAKGVRWRGGFATLGGVMADAAADMPAHYLIDFVTARD